LGSPTQTTTNRPVDQCRYKCAKLCERDGCFIPATCLANYRPYEFSESDCAAPRLYPPGFFPPPENNKYCLNSWCPSIGRFSQKTNTQLPLSLGNSLTRSLLSFFSKFTSNNQMPASAPALNPSGGFFRFPLIPPSRF
jgi:hypothetical protein